MADDRSQTPPRISRLVTAGALVLAGVHVVFPKIQIDNITLGLLAIAVVPWLAPIFKRVELPGGLKLEFQEFKEKVVQELRENRSQVENIAQRVEELAQFAISGAAPAPLKERLARDLSAFRTYLMGLGIDLSGEPPTVVIPEKVYENAHYDGRTNEIVVGKNFAASDVLFREYTHHVLRQERGKMGLISDQQDPVESALADYYPCSYRNDPLVGREVAEHDRRITGIDRPALRDLETTAKLSDVNAQPNTPQIAGEIWSAAFWEIRKVLGQNTTDLLLLQAWRDVPAGPKAEAAFVKKIRTLADASHRHAVEEAFASRELS